MSLFELGGTQSRRRCWNTATAAPRSPSQQWFLLDERRAHCTDSPDGPGADTASPGADTASPGADTASPGADTASPGTDTASPGTDTASPGADTASPGTDTASPGTDTASPGTDTASPGADTASSGADTASPGTDPASPGADTASSGADTASPGAATASRDRPALGKARQYRDLVASMFAHAYGAYIAHAFPADELMPISCSGHDTLGGYCSSACLSAAFETVAESLAHFHWPIAAWSCAAV
jgi:hypothetical protein